MGLSLVFSFSYNKYNGNLSWVTVLVGRGSCENSNTKINNNYNIGNIFSAFNVTMGGENNLPPTSVIDWKIQVIFLINN